MPKVIQSNNSDLIGKPFYINKTGISLGVFLPTNITIKSITDSRIEVNQVVGKSMGRTVGGAIVGGLLTGGVGAIVGAMACGNNKIKTTKTVAIEYGKKNWIVVEFGDGMGDTALFNESQKVLGKFQASPFAG